MARHALRTILAPAVACALTATVGAGVMTPANATIATGSAALQTKTAQRASSADIRVGSFNIQSVGLDKTSGQQRPWKKRRATVVKQIMGEHVDVIGVQEAAYSAAFKSRLVSGTTQYLDLRNGLNAAGGDYALTNRKAVDCARPYTTYKCRTTDQDASYSERILYNKKTVTLVRKNAMRYTRQGKRNPNAYLTWAVLKSRATGDNFLFTSTHLDPSSRAIRKAQWKQMIRKIKQIRNGLPTISVGDFNTTKFDSLARTMLPAMRHARLGDVLNQQYKVNPSVNVRAESRVNGWLNTVNHLTRNVATFGYEDRHDKTGNGIDYVFASNRLRVKEYKVVCDFNPQTLRVQGTLPSDHNMVRATITIP